jgi:hypothetical protein
MARKATRAEFVVPPLPHEVRPECHGLLEPFPKPLFFVAGDALHNRRSMHMLFSEYSNLAPQLQQTR